MLLVAMWCMCDVMGFSPCTLLVMWQGTWNSVKVMRPHLSHHHAPPYTWLNFASRFYRALAPSEPSLMPRPRPFTRIKVSVVTFGRFLDFIKLIAFLCEEFCLRQSRSRKHNLWLQHPKFLTTSTRWHGTFLARKLVISLQLSGYKFLINEARGISRMSPGPFHTFLTRIRVRVGSI